MPRILASLLSAALLLALVQPALAAKPVREKLKMDETFPAEVCGVAVTAHAQVNVSFRIRSDGTVIDTTSVRLTFSDADGDWLSLFIAGAVKVTETENPDGTITAHVEETGIRERLRSSEGTLVMDRGRVITEFTVDLGDPADPTDDTLISADVVFIAGPHPELESGFTLFCEAVLSVLE